MRFLLSIVFSLLCVGVSYSQWQGIPKVYLQLQEGIGIGSINQEEKLFAMMRFENANGSQFTSEKFHNGLIRISGRGNSSWNLPGPSGKRSYSIDLVNSSDKKIQIPLLGMPASADFILFASAFDKTFLRNYFSYELARSMGHWASRSRFVELYINGDYRGLYVLCENIRNEPERAHVGEGGFIIEQDYPQRLVAENAGYFASSRQYAGRYYKDTPATDNLYFGFKYPIDEERTEAQTNYARDYIHDFETALYGSNFKDPNEGYRKYIDVNSFADWYILAELGNDWDHAYFLSSCYLSKPQDGKMKMMPVWDFDVAHRISTTNLSARNNVPWISRLWEDEAFRQLVFARCSEIVPLLDNALSHIENVAARLNDYGALDRNFEKWDILGKHIYWWNYRDEPIPETYEGEVRELTQWIRQRFLLIATFGNSNYCDVLSQMKPAIRVIDQNIYDNATVPIQVETSSFRETGFTPRYVWNNVSQGSRQYNITDYGKYSVTVTMGTCQSLPSDTLYIKRLATVAVSDNQHVYDGTPKSVTISTNPSSLRVRITYNGETAPPVEPGTYRVVAEIDDAGYKGKQVSTMVITPTENGGGNGQTNIVTMNWVEKIYPNPATDYVDVMFAEYGRYVIRMIDMSGRILTTLRVDDMSVRINTGVYPPGVYILQIENFTNRSFTSHRVLIHR